MGRIIIFCISFSLSFGAFASSGNEIITLRPSLTVQMQKNTEQLQKIKKEEKLRNVRTRAEGVKKINQSIVRTSSYQKTLSALTPTNKPPLKTTASVNNISPATSVILSSAQESIPGVDMNTVRSTWLSWYNSTRSSMGLQFYSFDSRLDMTAHDWNIEFARGKGQNHHRRHSSDSYYDFPVIDSWFKIRGIDPIVVNHAKHVENVGYGYYSCHTSDCTDELIQSIRSTYDFFMSEKGKSYDAHYRSIVQPNFSKIGLDIITVPSDNRYYMTIHYITQ